MAEISGNAVYIHSRAHNAAERLGFEVYRLGSGIDFNEIVVLCVGTDRATGDSLGPLTGHLLCGGFEGINEGIKLFGTLDAPVHAKNLGKTMEMIKCEAENPLIIVVDACLGKTRHIGYLTVGRGGITPGAGVKKPLPSVGDVFVTGIVNFGGVMEFQILQNTRLNIVMKMAEVISGGIRLGAAMLGIHAAAGQEKAEMRIMC